MVERAGELSIRRLNYRDIIPSEGEELPFTDNGKNGFQRMSDRAVSREQMFWVSIIRITQILSRIYHDIPKRPINNGI